MLKGIGETIVVKEELMDAITAVSGSGPAYVFLFVECMMKAAGNLGLTPAQSKELVYKTLTGSAHLLEKSKDDAATLRAKVTSKGGTTQAATDVFMARHIEKIFTDALTAARNRAKELAK
jgi:pyrroline-5-carboxylate reductase